MTDPNVADHSAAEQQRLVLRPADEQRAATPVIRTRGGRPVTSAAQQSGPRW